MHIGDGMIPLVQTLFYLPIAFLFVVLSLIMTFSWAIEESNKKKIIILVVLFPVIFALQAMNIPIPWGTSAHVVGAALAAIILGSPFPVVLLMTLILFTQTILFGDGGVTTIGANIINMGIISSFVGFYSYRAIKNKFGMIGMVIGSFIAAWLSIFIAAEACALELYIAGTFPLKQGLELMGIYHAVTGVVEGIITAFVVIIMILLTGDSTNDEKHL